jgi:hypothetical protein
MAIELTISNILQFAGFISPTLLVFFLFLSSLFNENLKGLIYLAGILIASIINVFLMNLIGTETPIDAAFSCNLFEIPFVGTFNNPAPSSVMIAFTIAYLVLPMKYNNELNYAVIMVLFCMLGLDFVTKTQNKCTSYAGSILGCLVGFLLGATWYTLFHLTGYDSLLYFNELQSNNVVCSRPSKQTFKCSVYKNGELISSNVS